MTTGFDTLRRAARAGGIALAIVILASCASGRALKRGQQAAAQGDWDTAVAHYREALVRDPDSMTARVQLQRAMRMAAAEHGKRAASLEAEDQLPGAISEYRLAADLDPGNTFYLTKARQLEQVLRDRIEASTPPTRIETLREQAAQTSPFPRLDPRQPVYGSFPNAAARDILRSISEITGITISYDRNVDSQLTQAYPIEIAGEPIERVLTQLLAAFNMTYKIQGPRAIFIYQDSAANRQKYEDLYEVTFYIEHGDVNEITNLLTQFTQGGVGVRPVIYQLKSMNAIAVKAPAPMLQMIEQLIRINDKPRAEVVLDIEVLEVSRIRVKELGIDLSQYALGFMYSPELAPPATAAAPGLPPMPPPINLGSFSGSPTRNDFFVTVPSALIKLLETDSRTKLLARPQLRGREGVALQLNIGNEVPIPQTQFQAAVPGGVQNQPVTSIQYRNVGVNLTVTPRVTYGDEIILENLIIQRSGLGGSLDVGGQPSPIITSRTASTTIRLRHGESNLLAGLVSNSDTDDRSGVAGLSQIPVLGRLFGSGRRTTDETDIIMIITPYIVRGHEVTAEDLKPRHVGTTQNPGIGGAPQLFPPGTAPPPALAPPGTGTPITPGAAQQPPPTGGAATPPAAGGGPPRAVGIVPIDPVGGAAKPEPPAGARAAIVPAGTEHPQGNVFAAPVVVSGLSQVGTISVSVTYDPKVLRATNVTQGTFMSAGGVQTTFAPKIDAQVGRVDIAISRPSDQPGAATVEQALLAAVNFQAVAAGSSQVTLAVVATSPTGQPITIATTPVTITVK